MHQITSQIRTVVPDVFRTMIRAELTCDVELEDQVSEPWPAIGVIGSVSFTGKMSGVLYLIFPEPLALFTTESILGKGPYQENDINDVVGEMTNIVTGNLKSKMCDLGFNCQLSIPTVVRGNDITIDTTIGNLALINSFKVLETNENLSVLIFATLEK